MHVFLAGNIVQGLRISRGAVRNKPSGPPGCGEIRRLFDAYVDAELSGQIEKRVAKHLRTCSSCNSVVRQQGQWKARLRGAVNGTQVPEKFRDGVRDLLRR